MASIGGAASAENKWSTSFWACGGSLSICCSTFWCPCVVYAQNREEIDGNDRFWRNCLVLPAITAAYYLGRFGLMLAIGGPAGISADITLSAYEYSSMALAFGASAALASCAAPGRAALRQHLSLPEAPGSDWCAYFWCSGLALCQEAAQLRRHKKERDAELAEGRYSMLSLEAPEAQSMLA